MYTDLNKNQILEVCTKCRGKNIDNLKNTLETIFGEITTLFSDAPFWVFCNSRTPL